MQNGKQNGEVKIHSPIPKRIISGINVGGALYVQIPEKVMKTRENKHHTRCKSMESHCIVFPNHTSPVSHFALDIGGSLVKVAYFEAENSESKKIQDGLGIKRVKSPIPISLPSNEHKFENCYNLDTCETLPERPDTPIPIQPTSDAWSAVHAHGGRICFARFETSNMEECLNFIDELTKQYGKCKTVHATGGGAFKFAELLKKRLGITIKKVDEMQSLINGLNILLSCIKNESFTYHYDTKEKEYISFKGKQVFPYLLVNIGSGVSILKVTDYNKYERVSGSSLGGGTFWGLCSMLTGAKTFDEVLAMTTKGDNKKVDMLVGDIYGRDYSNIGLSSDTIASSFGKAIRRSNDQSPPDLKPADMAKSLLYMICNNIAQIAYLNAMRYNLKRIYFAGYFIRDHPVTMSAISYAVNYWSQGQIQALFLKHEGYLGAVGSFFSAGDVEPQNMKKQPVQKKTL